MGNPLVNGGLAYVVTAFVITWIVLAATLIRVVGAVRRARAEYESARQGEFRT